MNASPSEITVHHDFAFDRRFALVDRLIGVTEGTTGVDIDAVEFRARFGPWCVATPTTNLHSAVVTGPYNLLRVIGLPHVSLADGGLTFATNAKAGVCIRFRQPVTGLLPFGLATHHALTVTVSEPGALAEFICVLARSEPEPVGYIGIDDVAERVHTELENLTATELRRRAGELGLTRTSRLNKAQLIDLLQEPIAGH
jgi:hypothetical protein